VIAGFTTNHCVSSTARSACDLGFKTVVIRDACVAFELDDVDGNRMPAEALHAAGLAELQGEFAMVLPAAAILQLL
jgi:nicotinamidase-related amidase